MIYTVLDDVVADQQAVTEPWCNEFCLSQALGRVHVLAMPKFLQCGACHDRVIALCARHTHWRAGDGAGGRLAPGVR